MTPQEKQHWQWQCTYMHQISWVSSNEVCFWCFKNDPQLIFGAIVSWIIQTGESSISLHSDGAFWHTINPLHTFSAVISFQLLWQLWPSSVSVRFPNVDAFHTLLAEGALHIWPGKMEFYNHLLTHVHRRLNILEQKSMSGTLLLLQTASVKAKLDSACFKMMQIERWIKTGEAKIDKENIDPHHQRQIILYLYVISDMYILFANIYIYMYIYIIIKISYIYTYYIYNLTNLYMQFYSFFVNTRRKPRGPSLSRKCFSVWLKAWQ